MSAREEFDAEEAPKESMHVSVENTSPTAAGPREAITGTRGTSPTEDKTVQKARFKKDRREKHRKRRHRENVPPSYANKEQNRRVNDQTKAPPPFDAVEAQVDTPSIQEGATTRQFGQYARPHHKMTEPPPESGRQQHFDAKEAPGDSMPMSSMIRRKKNP